MARFDVAWRATDRLVGMPRVPALPAGAMVELPGRGSTYVVDTGGDRPPLVLLHALACTGLLTWYPSLEVLRQRYRLVIFDQRWHGQGIRSPRFRLEDCADDVVAVADALGVEQIVPVGYSMGSLVAQVVARRHPDRVAGAVFAASTTKFRRGDADPYALRVVATRIARATERRLRAAPVLDPVDGVVDGERWALGQFRSTNSREVAGALAVLSRFDSSPWISELRMPTAVVVTARDRAIRPARQRELARRLPESTAFEVDTGHAACVLRADRFRPALLAATASVVTRAHAACESSPEQH
jgi:pimeloyl-ACP methyl ester carboxylesterase